MERVEILMTEPPDSKESSTSAEEAAVAAVQQAIRDVEAVVERVETALTETPNAGPAFPVAPLGCGHVSCGFQGRPTLAAEFCSGGILTLTTWAPTLEGTPTLVTKLHPFGILKLTA